MRLLLTWVDPGPYAQVGRKLDGWILWPGMVSHREQLAAHARLGRSLHRNSRTNNATIEVIIEDDNFNNTLAGSLACPNSGPMSSSKEARQQWIDLYLKNGKLAVQFVASKCSQDAATSRFQSMTEGFEWTTDDVYAAQTMCPYETVSYGFSKFCDLFTYKEWEDFGYSIDLNFAGYSGFHSPTGVRSLFEFPLCRVHIH